jgi:outer membrane protein OmpA-like peptidoglycan-associated protein
MSHGQVARTVALASGVAAALLLGGCARRVPPSIEQARAAYDDAAAQPELAENAPVALHEAEQALRDAARDWDDQHSEDEAEHDAYLVRQRLAIARAVADRKLADASAHAAAASTTDARLAARERELAELRARRTNRGLEVTLGDVLFETDRPTLKPGAEDTLATLAAVLRDDPARHVLVEGHSDAAGSAQDDSGLSDERANAVRDYLVGHGIAPDRILATGYGEAYPVASNDTDAGRQQNRRVEVVILDRGGPAGDDPRPVSDDGRAATLSAP